MSPASPSPPPRGEPVTLLGSTGALGRLALEEILAAGARFRVVALAAGRQAEALARQALACHRRTGTLPRLAVADEGAAARVRRALAGVAPAEVHVGASGLRRLAGAAEAGRVVCTIGGLPAWPAVAAAAEAGHHAVVSSKEVLAVAGHHFRERAEERGGSVRVLDSELSAAARLLDAQGDAPVARLILPASGGPFRTRPRADLARVTPEEAVAHPVWSMGPKISVDSATLVNKAHEVVVAHRVLGVSPRRIEVEIHPEARVHAILETADGREWALAAPADMRLPLRHLLGLPTPEARVVSPRPRTGATFSRVEPGRFPGMELGHGALARGPGAVAALVGADEAAVAAFLAGRLPFDGVVPWLARTVAEAAPIADEPAALYAATEAARDRLERALAG